MPATAAAAAASSPRAATCKAFSSAVLGVAPYVIANKLRNMQEIKHYGKGKVVSCCVLENALAPSSVGCTRRCTLCLPGYEDKLLRECLTGVVEHRSGIESLWCSEEDRHGGANGPVADAAEGEVKGNYKVEVELAYLPCSGCEAHRSVFSRDTDAAIAHSKARLTVTEVSSAVNRCFLAAEVVVTFTHSTSLAGVDDATRLAQRTAEREVLAFWQAYLDALVQSLESAIVAENHPILNSVADVEFRRAYEGVEEVFCQWSAASSATLPRADVLTQMEAALRSWSRVLREYRHVTLSAETAKGDAAGSRHIAAETARQLADRTAAVHELEQQLTHLQDTDARLQELAATTATVCAMRQDMDRQRRARQLLVEQHKRQYSSQPGAAGRGSRGSGGHLLPSSPSSESVTAPRPRAATMTPAANGTLQNTGAPQGHTSFHKAMLAKLFRPDGTMDDVQAREIFHALARRPVGERGDAGSTAATDASVSAKEVQAVLMAMDHVGLYEDVDGTQDQLKGWRTSVQASFASRYGAGDAAWPATSCGTTAGRQASMSDGAAASDRSSQEGDAAGSDDGGERAAEGSVARVSEPQSALMKMVHRHDAQKEERRWAAMAKLADDTVARYAFRETDKLFFDEFCLALMHLFK